MSAEKGIVKALFDLSFTEFVTTRLIRFLFVLAIISSAIMAVFFVVAVVSTGEDLMGIVALVLAPVVFLLYVLFSRIICELLIVQFRIAENTGRLVERSRAE